jgi:arsenate reductase-like glutaredoxin family protein
MPRKIAENIFGHKEKTASEFRSELFSSFQSEEVAPKFARYLEEGPHKEAYTKIINEKANTKFERSERGVYEKSANYVRDLRKQAEDKLAAAIEHEYQTNRFLLSHPRKVCQSRRLQNLVVGIRVASILAIRGEGSAVPRATLQDFTP